MSLPSKVLVEHHRYLDDVFATAEGSVHSGDWVTAISTFKHFNDQLQAHIEAEEGLLFPAFEEATGYAEGPTRVMRMEHEQIRSLLAQLEFACAERDEDAYSGAAETLAPLLAQHNMKEENILYPMCDQTLADGASDLGTRIEAMLGKD